MFTALLCALIAAAVSLGGSLFHIIIGSISGGVIALYGCFFFSRHLILLDKKFSK